MTDASEHGIYRAAIQGDRDAFEMVIRLTSRNLFAIAYGILQNREEAEDVVQDTFVKAWKSRWRVREAAKLPAWLATVARHRAHDILRRRRSVPLDELDLATSSSLAGELDGLKPSSFASAETEIAEAERRAQVRSAL